MVEYKFKEWFGYNAYRNVNGKTNLSEALNDFIDWSGIKISARDFCKLLSNYGVVVEDNSIKGLSLW